MPATAPRRRATRPTLFAPARRAARLAAGGDPQGALRLYMEAVRQAPHDADLHAAIAALLIDQRDPERAIGAALMATRCDPGSARAQAELGRAFFEAGQFQAALEPCARAVTLAPRSRAALVTFGATLFALGRHAQALAAAQEAVAIDPGHAPARANLALALEALGRLDEAEAQSRIALSLDPENPRARHNLAALRLSRGKLDAETWDLYEARFGLTPEAARLGHIPRWQGEDPANRTLLLHAEQGFGDIVQFIRFAPALQARGARVVLAVPPPLLRLMRTAPGVDQVVPAGQALPPHDAFCPLCSLPGLLGLTLDTIPAPIPYLHPTPEDVARLHPKPAGTTRPQIGLVWAGNPGFVHDRARSIPPAALATLQDLPGLDLHSLQKDALPPFPMHDRMPAATDFADTAALIARLDLVIAVDTAVAHLAGAMGRPVWLLSRFMGCWRWLRDRDDTPWYPTMRIFRQPRPNDWDAVLADVKSALLSRYST